MAKKPVYGVRLAEGEREWLDKKASTKGVSSAEILRDLVKKAMEEDERK